MTDGQGHQGSNVHNAEVCRGRPRLSSLEIGTRRFMFAAGRHLYLTSGAGEVSGREAGGGAEDDGVLQE